LKGSRAAFAARFGVWLSSLGAGSVTALRDNEGRSSEAM
jgi:hypothetical protein